MPHLTSNHQSTDAINHQKKINDINTELNQLIKEQNLKKSFLSRMASWYSNLSIWIKLGLGVLTATASGVAGIFLMPYFLFSPLVSAAIGLLSYLIPSLVLVQHQRAEKNHQTALAAEILKLKTVLQESISAFDAMKAPMDKILSSLEAKNQEKAKDIQTFKQSVSSFKNNVDDVAEALLHTQKSQISLAHNNQNLSESIDDLKTSQHDMKNVQQDLVNMNQAIFKTHQKLQKSASLLEDLNEGVVENIKALKARNQQFEALENNAVKNQTAINRHMNFLQNNINQIRNSHETPEQQQESNETLVQRAINAVAHIDRNRAASSTVLNLDDYRRSYTR